MPTVVSKIFQTLKRWWMKFAAGFGWVNTRVLLTVVYIVLFGIIGVIIKLLRKDLLHKRTRKTTSYWSPKEKAVHSLEHAKHQF